MDRTHVQPPTDKEGNLLPKYEEWLSSNHEYDSEYEDQCESSKATTDAAKWQIHNGILHQRLSGRLPERSELHWHNYTPTNEHFCDGEPYIRTNGLLVDYHESDCAVLRKRWTYRHRKAKKLALRIQLDGLANSLDAEDLMKVNREVDQETSISDLSNDRVSLMECSKYALKLADLADQKIHKLLDNHC